MVAVRDQPDTSQKTEGRDSNPRQRGKPPETVSRPRRSGGLLRSLAVSGGVKAGLIGPRRGPRLQVEDKRERFVDGLLLVSSQPTSELAETVDVDCAKLLDEHACPLVGEVDLGSERSGC